MVNLGKNKQGQRFFITFEQIADAATNPFEYRKELNNQQWAKLRKLINRYKKSLLT